MIEIFELLFTGPIDWTIFDHDLNLELALSQLVDFTGSHISSLYQIGQLHQELLLFDPSKAHQTHQ